MKMNEVPHSRPLPPNIAQAVTHLEYLKLELQAIMLWNTAGQPVDAVIEVQIRRVKVEREIVETQDKIQKYINDGATS